MADVSISAQNGDHRFLIDAGGSGNLQKARIYDLLFDTLGGPEFVGTIRVFEPGWIEPFAIESVLDYVRKRVATLLRATRPAEG